MKQGWMTANKGNKYHYKDDKFHSINDQPAMIYSNGDKFWYKNNKLHRDNDQPAVIYYDDSKYWFQNGKRHRTTGPAVMLPSGTKEWWINGNQLTKEEFNKQLKETSEEKQVAIEAPSNENYPHTCPNCKSPAYISFLNKIDCSRKCK